MAIKLFDSELKVMDVLWKEGDMTAKRLSDILKAEIGWNMNTTYTVIKKSMAKGAIERSEPNFLCHALIPKETVQEAETDELIGKPFDGKRITRRRSEYLHPWNSFFSGAPLMQANNLNGLFELLDNQPRSTKAGDAAEQIKVVLDRTTHGISE